MTTAAAPPKTRPTRLQRRLIRALSRDLQTLIPAMERDLQRAFRDLGSRAVRALRGTTFKSMDTPGALAWAEGYLKQVDPTDAARVDAMTRSMRITEWEDKLLRPTYESSYLRTLDLTADTIRTQIALAVNLPDLAGRRIIAAGGRRVGLVDIHGQTRTALFHSLSEGRALGEGPDALARRIRDSVARGRYRSAATRAYVIARTETKYAQNLSSIELYQSMENVTGMIAFDAQVGATDAECEQRNGVVYSAADARGELALEHPLGTLSFAPEIGRPQRATQTATPPESTTPLPSLIDAARLPGGRQSVADRGFSNIAKNQITDPDVFAALPDYLPPGSDPNLISYAGTGSWRMNKALREGLELTPDDALLNQGLTRLAKVTDSLDNVVLTRGEQYFANPFSPGTQVWPTYRVGDFVDIAQWTSTSADVRTAAGFLSSKKAVRKIGYEIHVNGKVRAIITNRNETEAILAPGQRMRIVEIKHNVSVPSGSGTQVVDDWIVAVLDDAEDLASTVASAVDEVVATATTSAAETMSPVAIRARLSEVIKEYMATTDAAVRQALDLEEQVLSAALRRASG